MLIKLCLKLQYSCLNCFFLPVDKVCDTLGLKSMVVGGGVPPQRRGDRHLKERADILLVLSCACPWGSEH